MRIHVKNSTLVKPATETPNGSLWISNVDAILQMYHSSNLFFYRPTGVANFFDPAVLKAALSSVLVAFYPAAGRLSRNKNGGFEINCNSEGVLFVEAECDGTLDDLGDFTFKAEMDGTLVPVADYSQGISTFPLVLFQVTRFRCGGVSLGASFEHHLSDGRSAVHLLLTWSDVARGLDISLTPVIDRAHLSAREPPQPRFDHIEYQPPPELKIPQTATEITFSILKITRDMLNALKAKCKDGESSTVSYTTYEILAGHIWHCACKARGLPKDQVTKVWIPTDGRSRLKPPLPQGYFGNAIFPATPITLSGEIQSKPLKDIVSLIRESIERVDDDYIRSAIDYLELFKSDYRAFVAVGEHTYKCPNLGINSWVRFPVYDADFGWGRPIHMGPGEIPWDGRSYIMQNPANDGSLLLAISLQKEHMKLFEKFLHDI